MQDEIIIFNNAITSVTVDLTQGDRLTKFGRGFKVKVTNVDGSTEVTPAGYSVNKSLFGALYTQLTIEGISGNGYLILTSTNNEKGNSIINSNTINTGS